jgi:hypothetical protein
MIRCRVMPILSANEGDLQAIRRPCRFVAMPGVRFAKRDWVIAFTIHHPEFTNRERDI